MSSRVRTRLFVFLLLVILVGAAFFAHWWLIGRHYESTNNAYVQGEITRISSQLGAQVTEVLVDDNQLVEAGDVLVRLDSRDYEIAVQRAQANLATRQAERVEAQSRLAQQDSLIEAALADVSAKEAEQRRVEADIKRITPLQQSGYASEEQLSNFRAQLDVAKAQVRRAQADVQTQRLTKHTLQADIERFGALIDAARAEIAQAELDLARTEITAPAAGRIGQRSVRTGLNVQPGAHLMALVPQTNVWIQANFKETQIHGMHEDQPATLVFDAFPDEEVPGRIDSLFPASGAQFSLLPPENATGNFTKVVQRIPVKITVDPRHPLAGKLRPGMSVTVKVDLRG